MNQDGLGLSNIKLKFNLFGVCRHFEPSAQILKLFTTKISKINEWI